MNMGGELLVSIYIFREANDTAAIDFGLLYQFKLYWDFIYFSFAT